MKNQKIPKNTICFIFMVGILGCLDTLGMFARLKKVIRIGSRCCFGGLFGSYSSKMNYNIDFITFFKKTFFPPRECKLWIVFRFPIFMIPSAKWCILTSSIRIFYQNLIKISKMYVFTWNTFVCFPNFSDLYHLLYYFYMLWATLFNLVFWGSWPPPSLGLMAY